MVTTQGSETWSREAQSPEYTGYLHQSLLGTRFQQGGEWKLRTDTWVERSVDDEVCTTMTTRCSNKKKRQTSSSKSLEDSRRVLIVVQEQTTRCLRDQVPSLRTGGGTGRTQPINDSASHQRRLQRSAGRRRREPRRVHVGGMEVREIPEEGDAILTNHKGEVSRIFEEANQRQQGARSAQRTLDTLSTIFQISSFYFGLIDSDLVSYSDAQSPGLRASSICILDLVLNFRYSSAVAVVL